MRKIIFICLGLWLGGIPAIADTFQLNGGRTLTGEVLSADDTGPQIRVGDGQYERVPWSSFSQDDLKKFQTVPKYAALVEPFIEISQAEKLKKT